MQRDHAGLQITGAQLRESVLQEPFTGRLPRVIAIKRQLQLREGCQGKQPHARCPLGAAGVELLKTQAQTAKSPAFAGLSAMARGRLELPTLGL